MWKKVLILMIGIISIMFVSNNLFAQKKNFDDLSGKKWTGTRIVAGSNRMVIKASLEITKSLDGQVEGIYKMDTEGKEPSMINFKTSIEESPTGLPRFKFKSAAAEYQCELLNDGRLSTMRMEGRMASPHVLDPAK